jgi:hypothetical protein
MNRCVLLTCKQDEYHLDARSLSQDEANTLKQWILKQFGDKIKNVKVNDSRFDKTHRSILAVLDRSIQN